MNKNRVYVLALVGFLASCVGNQNKEIKDSIACSSGRTLLDGVCVRENVVDYISCVRARGTDLGQEKNSTLSAGASYVGIQASGEYEVNESQNRSYDGSDRQLMAIIEQCKNVASPLPSSKNGSESAIENSGNTLRKLSKHKIDLDGISFTLRSCSNKGGTVDCELSLKNNLPDQVLYLFAKKRTRAIDSFGKEFIAKSTSMGGSKPSFYTKKTMITDIPMVANVYFPNIPSDVTKFSMLEIHTYNKRLVFKDIDINSTTMD